MIDSLTECPPHLRYVPDTLAGWTRRRRGKGFMYLDEQARPIRKPADLDRIAQLVIPPMWQDVWICPLADGHLQATGYDQKRRKQYLYHPDWIAFRQQAKFAKMIEFGHALTGIRRQIIQDLKADGWPKHKVLALIVKLLDELHIRVGNECYRETNETFGLTTLRRKHLKESPGELRLEYKGKSGRYRRVSIRNKSLIRMIRETADLPGYEIFRYLEHGSSHPVDSSDVNQYIRQIAGDAFSAKDFRTWGGSVLAVEKYPAVVQETTHHPRRKLDTALVRAVAEELGNTLAVCREYYIHPQVLNVLVQGKLDSFRANRTDHPPRQDLVKPSEHLVLQILESATQPETPGAPSSAPTPPPISKAATSTSSLNL